MISASMLAFRMHLMGRVRLGHSTQCQSQLQNSGSLGVPSEPVAPSSLMASFMAIVCSELTPQNMAC